MYFIYQYGCYGSCDLVFLGLFCFEGGWYGFLVVSESKLE